MQRVNAFLGTGWSFPPTFTKAARGVQLVSDEEDIFESLHILLSTRPGERLMQPDYGCNLDYLQFEPLSVTTLSFVEGLIRNAILYYEPRIDLEKIEFDLGEQLEGKVYISLSIKVISTNRRFNLVYPYYLNESENVLENLLGGSPRNV